MASPSRKLLGQDFGSSVSPSSRVIYSAAGALAGALAPLAAAAAGAPSS